MAARHTNKNLIHAFLRRLDGASSMLDSFADDVVWHGCAPFDTQIGRDAVWRAYWQPLFHSFTNLRRRIDILLAGECEGEDWVATAGYIIGESRRDWLGIPATGRETHIRYGEFYRLERGKIVKAFVINDIVEVMHLAGCDPFPPSRGRTDLAPPPKTGDGILLEAQPQAATKKTFRLVTDMLFRGLNQFDQHDKDSMAQRRFWHNDMRWYGPAGIGATHGLHEFERDHQLPWLHAFPDRQIIWESPLFAEGHYAATAGWREVIARHSGDYLGFPATGKQIDFRVMDFWRRDGDRLRENWVLIDMIDMCRQFGHDILRESRRA